MAKYVYPAVFTPEDEGGFSVNFPSLKAATHRAILLQELWIMQKMFCALRHFMILKKRVLLFLHHPESRR